MKKNKFSRELSGLEKRLAKSGLKLKDGSKKVKAVAFVGGVRKSTKAKNLELM